MQQIIPHYSDYCHTVDVRLQASAAKAAATTERTAVNAKAEAKVRLNQWLWLPDILSIPVTDMGMKLMLYHLVRIVAT